MGVLVASGQVCACAFGDLCCSAVGPSATGWSSRTKYTCTCIDSKLSAPSSGQSPPRDGQCPAPDDGHRNHGRARFPLGLRQRRLQLQNVSHGGRITTNFYQIQHRNTGPEPIRHLVASLLHGQAVGTSSLVSPASPRHRTRQWGSSSLSRICGLALTHSLKMTPVPDPSGRPTCFFLHSSDTKYQHASYYHLRPPVPARQESLSWTPVKVAGNSNLSYFALWGSGTP